ncbi:unnamed protein product [Darwinula stevensoni]|uniref:Uncharacterized protein n=1 Tax=Darwinula stevensoni TaxID=69355 RepID=A0A7R9A858_9CRUS|nr:unnamed protein product [Darwinula stevensoni]CAG0895655.1 unnamed protein product [Darwinula stevensoni]
MDHAHMYESPGVSHPAMQSIPTRDFELMLQKLLSATDPVHDDAIVENLASLLQEIPGDELLNLPCLKEFLKAMLQFPSDHPRQVDAWKVMFAILETIAKVDATWDVLIQDVPEILTMKRFYKHFHVLEPSVIVCWYSLSKQFLRLPGWKQQFMEEDFLSQLVHDSCHSSQYVVRQSEELMQALVLDDPSIFPKVILDAQLDKDLIALSSSGKLLKESTSLLLLAMMKDMQEKIMGGESGKSLSMHAARVQCHFQAAASELFESNQIKAIILLGLDVLKSWTVLHGAVAKHEEAIVSIGTGMLAILSCPLLTYVESRISKDEWPYASEGLQERLTYLNHTYQTFQEALLLLKPTELYSILTSSCLTLHQAHDAIVAIPVMREIISSAVRVLPSLLRKEKDDYLITKLIFPAFTLHLALLDVDGGDTGDLKSMAEFNVEWMGTFLVEVFRMGRNSQYMSRILESIGSCLKLCGESFKAEAKNWIQLREALNFCLQHSDWGVIDGALQVIGKLTSSQDLERLLDKKMIELIRECVNTDEPYVRASALQVFRLFLSFDSIVSQHGFSQKSARELALGILEKDAEAVTRRAAVDYLCSVSDAEDQEMLWRACLDFDWEVKMKVLNYAEQQLHDQCGHDAAATWERLCKNGGLSSLFECLNDEETCVAQKAKDILAFLQKEFQSFSLPHSEISAEPQPPESKKPSLKFEVSPFREEVVSSILDGSDCSYVISQMRWDSLDYTNPGFRTEVKSIIPAEGLRQLRSVLIKQEEDLKASGELKDVVENLLIAFKAHESQQDISADCY